jgi:serine acetyltransferase
MKKALLRRACNRVFHVMARVCPGATSLRPALHRARGVSVGQRVFIGDDVYLDNEYPECIQIGENVQISIRAVLIAHTRGPGRIVVGKDAFVGPHTVIACGAGRTLTIGEGAVIGPGCVVTRSVPPRAYLAVPTPRPSARVGVPLPSATTMDQFMAGLQPWTPSAAGDRESGETNRKT